MIQIVLSDMAYENDVYPLVKAFYPNETIKVNTEVMEASILIQIDFAQDKVSIRVKDNNKELSQAVSIADLTKANYKNSVKRLLYALLASLTDKVLPWGILTGIRPTKIVYELLEAGKSETQIYSHMREVYLCSKEKTDVSISIAKRERELLREVEYLNGYSLYIGIPFCPSTCLYCSFTSYSAEKFSSYMDDYLNALEMEIDYAATCFPNKKLTTVYIGGGTPTTLSEQQLERLLIKVRQKFNLDEVKEFCVEAGRPDSITREKLILLKSYGVDRISINPQSMQQRTLDLIGRRHSVEQIKEAFAMAREVGHTNINMDIIIGLPGEDRSDVDNTLAQINDLNPDSITVHTLALKRAARLNIENEKYTELQASDVAGMLEDTISYAAENGYLPYYLYRQKNMAENLENIGYARWGKEGLYNILIMEEKQTIIALGAGAMSKFVFHKENRLERVDNVKSVMDYINRIDEMIEKKDRFLKDNYDYL